MFDAHAKKQRPEASKAIHTLLGKGTLWKGEIHAAANSLRIEGQVDGTIHSEGEVTIAPTGLVKGTIHAKHLIVTGRVEGIFHIQECLEIHGTGWVEGEVEVGSLVVDEGGTLQGSCTRHGIAPKDAREAGKDRERDKEREKEREKETGPLPAVPRGREERFPERSTPGANGTPAPAQQDNPFAKAFVDKKN